MVHFLQRLLAAVLVILLVAGCTEEDGRPDGAAPDGAPSDVGKPADAATTGADRGPTDAASTSDASTDASTDGGADGGADANTGPRVGIMFTADFETGALQPRNGSSHDGMGVTTMPVSGTSHPIFKITKANPAIVHYGGAHPANLDGITIRCTGC